MSKAQELECLEDCVFSILFQIFQELLASVVSPYLSFFCLLSVNLYSSLELVSSQCDINHLNIAFCYRHTFHISIQHDMLAHFKASYIETQKLNI